MLLTFCDKFRKNMDISVYLFEKVAVKIHYLKNYLKLKSIIIFIDEIARM